MTKYIFVTGGVVSGIGKGITAASLGALLKARGFKIFVQKFDPYLNVDPGTMSPFQHGEVFVTDDGAETDLDLGHYERFIDENLNSLSTLTTGMVYSEILKAERKGKFLGHTVQVIPHVTNEIKRRIILATEKVKPDIQIIEIGGTVGDIESLPFLEAIRQIQLEKGNGDVIFIHTTLLPYLNTSKELKTKPTQNSVKTLMSLGITPDFLVLRADRDIPAELNEKISRMCTIKQECVISLPDLDSIYDVPLYIHKQNIDELICKKFKINRKIDIRRWEEVFNKHKNLNNAVTIGLVGKYVELEDSYISIKEALKHTSIQLGVKINIKWFNSGDLDVRQLKKVDGILVPGGFGAKDIDGKIKAIKYAREKGIPFLGIGLGMELAIIEFARNVLGIKDADSAEFNHKTLNPVIDYLPNQYKGANLGVTMRIGAYDCEIKTNTKAHKIYKSKKIIERHRHRFEFNNSYIEQFEKNGIIFSGINPLTNLVEIIELKDHPYFIGVIFHPEFKSRPIKAHPLFVSFIKSVLEKKN